MKESEQMLQQVQRALRKAASKFPADAETFPMTDLYLKVKQESGELLVYNDDDTELTRCVVEEWIGNSEEAFYTDIQPILTNAIKGIKDITENVAILKPYSYVLMDEEGETIADLYLVDDDTAFIDGDLMQGLSEDLDQFWASLEQK